MKHVPRYIACEDYLFIFYFFLHGLYVQYQHVCESHGEYPAIEIKTASKDDVSLLRETKLCQLSKK